jgi:four helix bundle protein
MERVLGLQSSMRQFANAPIFSQDWKAMDEQALKVRTRDFAIRIVRLFQVLPKSTEAQVIGRQLLRSGTSVAANYRAACRARSKAEFVSKIGIVVEEADETVFWIDLLGATAIFSAQKLSVIAKEADELLAIFAASQLTAKGLRKV